MQRAALCHDLLEDTAFGESALKEMIGTNAAELVNELTLNFEGRTIREAVAPVANYSDGAFLIKLADILDNVSKSVFLASHNKKGFYQDFFLPLIEVYQEIIEQKLPYVELGQFACISLAEEITGQLCSLRKVVAVLDDSSSFD
jgi:hypothetical protein